MWILAVLLITTAGRLTFVVSDGNVGGNNEFVRRGLTNLIDPEVNSQGKMTSEESLKLGDIIFESSSSVTFVASNKTAEVINVTDWKDSGTFTHVVQLSPEFKPESVSFLEGSATNDSVLPSQGLVHTVLTAYKDHHNLVLSPDDIWTAILIQFSRHVNANAESLRHLFVSHKGKKTLKFNVGSSRSSAGGNVITRRDWEEVFRTIPLKLKKATNPAVSNFVQNNFSTTTDQMRIVSGLTFLSTLQHYYEYVFSILCGIPWITILGNLNDWEDIRNRVQNLKTFGDIPSEWSDILTPIIDQFINAKQGNIVGEFWEDIVKIQKNAKCGGGGQPDEVLDGWLAAFAVFDAEGKWKGEKLPEWKWPRINMKDVATGVVTVPIQFEKKGLNHRVNATIFAGHMGHHVSEDGMTLTPYAGWGVAISKSPTPEIAPKPKPKSSVFESLWEKVFG